VALPTSVTCRPAVPGDRPFMLRLYAGVREPELEAAGMPVEQRGAFIAQQFDAQSRHYETYRDATVEVILVDGEPAGRLIVDRGPDELRVVDIALLAKHRGQGIGGALLGELLEEADARGLKARVHVERSNPALRLYTRLGFRLHSEAGIYLLLERPPFDQAKKAS
jgi:ribosomal protein S18 acetylase RimI-like enzyme